MIKPLHRPRLCAGSWQEFWFNGNFSSMIFGQIMAKIRYGGASRTVAFWPFLEVVRCDFFSEFGVQAFFFHEQFIPPVV
jgi:hypothetical protein